MSQYFDSINWSTSEELLKQVLQHDSATESKIPEYTKWWATHPNVLLWFQNSVESGCWYTEHLKIVVIPGDERAYAFARFNEFYNIKEFGIVCEYWNKFSNYEAAVPITRKVWNHALKIACQTSEPYQGSIILPLQIWKFVIGGVTYTLKSLDSGCETQIQLEFETEDDLIEFELPEELKYVSREIEIGGHDLIDYWESTRQSSL